MKLRLFLILKKKTQHLRKNNFETWFLSANKLLVTITSGTVLHSRRNTTIIAI